MAELVKKKPSVASWWQVTLEEEQRKNPKLKLENIREFREWLESQPHLPSEIDDLTLVMYIHGADYDLEYAKYLLSNNYYWRTHKNIFRDRDPLSDGIQHVIHNVAEYAWFEESKTGYVIMYCNLKETDSSKFDAVYFGTVPIMMMELLQLKKGTIPGVKVIENLNNLTFIQLAKCLLYLIATITPFMQEYNTQTCSEIHVVNNSYLSEKISEAIQPILSRRMKNRIYFHKNNESLAKHFDPEFLLEEFGGTGPSLSKLSEKTNRILVEHRDYFLEEAKIRIDETKRPKIFNLFSYFSK